MPETIEFEGQQIHLIGPMQEIQNILEASYKLTRRPERMCVLIGDQGMGKTVGCRLFASRKKDVCYIQIPPAEVLSGTRLLRILQDALEIVNPERNRYDALIQIIQELRRKPRMIILDNANRIRGYNFLDLFRYIHDESGCRMVFVSIPALEYMFTRHREFAGRVNLHWRLKPASKEDVAALLPKFADGCLETFYELTGGRLREVMVLAHHLETLASKRGGYNAIKPTDISRIAKSITVRAAA